LSDKGHSTNIKFTIGANQPVHVKEHDAAGHNYSFVKHTTNKIKAHTKLRP